MTADSGKRGVEALDKIVGKKSIDWSIGVGHWRLYVSIAHHGPVSNADKRELKKQRKDVHTGRGLWGQIRDFETLTKYRLFLFSGHEAGNIQGSKSTVGT